MPKLGFVFFAILLFFQPILGISPPFSGNLPWLTGPIFTPSARVVPVGHVNMEPYVLYRDINGVYDKNWKKKKHPDFHHVTSQLVIKGGVCERVNLSCVLQSHYKATQNVSGAGIGDLPIGVDIQLIQSEKDNIPFKLTIQESFPTGRYQKLSSTKKGTDATGLGSFITQVALTISKLFHFQEEHYLNARLNMAGAFYSPVKVKGRNIYGGDRHTHGKVLSAWSCTLQGSFEYTLTRNWALASDLTFNWIGKKRTKGFVTANRYDRIQISATPSIEYNFNQNVGIIVGAWISLAGRNSDHFLGGAAALNWYF